MSSHFQRPRGHLQQGGPADQRWEDVQHGVPPLLGGGRKPDPRSIQSDGNGGGKILCGEATRESGVQGVWGGNRGWIHVESSDDSAWEGRSTTTPLGPSDGQGDQDV